VVPTGPLQSLPWSVLPSRAGRPTTVTPSATLWAATPDRPPGDRSAAARSVLVAAGPGLPGAGAEAAAVAAIHGSTALVPPASTVSAVLAALRDGSLVHLAAHGRLRADNPLFSEIRLADGPLVVYDIERLPAVAHTVVLAACDVGRSAVPAGGELLGLSATLLAAGTAQLVASVLPVPDAETAPLMVAFHRLLAAGTPAAAALATAQQRLADAEPASLAAAAGFVCIGSGRPAAPAAVPASLRS
jgi:CHAT domain-containing protein